MKTYELAAKECPVIREVDVVVCGGGPGGIGAAIAAARQGMKVALLERFGALGGLITTGLVNTCMSAVAVSGDKLLIRGIFEEMVNRCAAKGGAIKGYELKYSNKFFTYDMSRCEKDLQIYPFDPEVYKLAAEEYVKEYNIEVMYYTLVTDTIVEDRLIKGIVIENKSGTQILMAKQFIDATGDASIARMCGLPCALADGQKTPMTMMFHFGGASDVAPSYKPDVTEVPYGAVNFFPMMRNGEYRAEMTRYVGDTICGEDLTKATMACRAQIPEVIEYLKENVPGCKDIYLISSGSVIATLATPRIIGDYMLTKKDILELRMPKDRIALTAYGIDIHSTEEGGQNYLHWLNPGEYYGIPYGILYPKDGIDNLLAAGRVVSADYEASTAVACSGICMAVGEAAGTAAALCIQENSVPRKLDVEKLQKTLVENGAILDAIPVPDTEELDWTYYKRKNGEWNL